MARKTALVLMAYGTDTTGQGPSPMTRDVVKLAQDQEAKYPGAIYFLQGGYSANGGTPESEITRKLISNDRKLVPQMYLEETSKNTVEGAKQILKLAREHDVTRLVLVAQRIHARRVSYTFGRLTRGTRYTFKVMSAQTPFGGNSQKRLNSAFWWRIWEIPAWLATWLLLLRR
jgi:uncharacterized SAM-binding protein YcdF (DUF218 family)